jgi:hypothetical protein
LAATGSWGRLASTRRAFPDNQGKGYEQGEDDRDGQGAPSPLEAAQNGHGLDSSGSQPGLLDALQQEEA